MNKIKVLAFMMLFVGVIVGGNSAMATDDFDLFDEEKPVAKSSAPVSNTPASAPQKNVKKTVVKNKVKKTQPAASVQKSTKVNTKQSLSENLKRHANRDESQKKDTEDKKAGSAKRETWLESLISKGTGELFKFQDKKTQQEEKKRIEKVLQKRRSNAANFDISGIKLRMGPEEINKILTAQGYRRISQEIRIPNFIKWRSEELCRIHGIVGFERLQACARRVAQANGFEYVAYEIYNRYATRETLDVFYTSTFTDNLSHRILYKSNVPISTSKASQNIYINNLKIYDFWRRIDMRYGKPDNASEVKWGLGGKKPYLKAATGRLELVDPLLHDLDISRMLNEDSRLANTPYYTF